MEHIVPMFGDPRLRPCEGMTDTTRSAIAPLRMTVMTLFAKWKLPCLFADAEDGARKLLLVYRIFEVDWPATFAAYQIPFEWQFLPYDFASGTVHFLPGGTVRGADYPNIAPVYHSRPPATIASCQKEIDECLAERQGAGLALDEEARQRRLEEASEMEVPAVLLDVCSARNRDTPRNLRAYAEGVARAFDAVVDTERARETLQTEVTRLNGEVTQLTEELERFCTQGAPSTANPAETRERLQRAEASAVRATNLLRETNRRYQAELTKEKELASAARAEKKKASHELQSAEDAATIKNLRGMVQDLVDSNGTLLDRQLKLREDLETTRANEKKVVADLAARDAELLEETKNSGRAKARWRP